MSQGLGCLIWGTNASLGRIYGLVRSFLILVIMPGVWIFSRWCLWFSCLSYPFILCCGGIIQLVFNSFSQGIVPYIAICLMCLWEGGEFRVFLRCHLGMPYLYVYFFLLFFFSHTHKGLIYITVVVVVVVFPEKSHRIYISFLLKKTFLLISSFDYSSYIFYFIIFSFYLH